MNTHKTLLCRAILLALPIATFAAPSLAGFADEAAQHGASKSALEFAQYAGQVANADLQALLSSVSGAQAAQLAEDMLADANGAALNASLQNNALMQENIALRADSMRARDLQGNYNFGWNAWSSLLISHYQGDDNYDISGYDTSTFGLMVGLDKFIIAERVYIGYALAYANNQSDADDNLSDVNSENTQLFAYAGWINDTLFADASLNLGLNNVESTRTIRADNNALVVGHYDQLNMGYQLTVGKTFDLGGVILTPTLGYDSQWLSQQDYQESGSVAALRYDRETYHVQYATFGLAISQPFEWQEMTWLPSLKMHYSADLEGGQRVHDAFQLAVDNPNTKNNFYKKTGAIVGGNKFVVQAGLQASLLEDVSLSTVLSYTDAEEYNGVNFSLNLAKHF